MRFSSSISLAMPSACPRQRLPLLLVTLAMLLLLLSAVSSIYADSAKWRINPNSGDWHTASNWTPSTIPNGPSDVATFASSNRTRVSVSQETEVSSIVFDAGASAFTIIHNAPINGGDFIISGTGVTNNSGIIQQFHAQSGAYKIRFFNSATAGTGMTFTVGSAQSHGAIFFDNFSTAGNASFAVGTPVASFGNQVIFFGNSTAENGTFMVDATGGVAFLADSSAANGSFTLKAAAERGFASAYAQFSDDATAGNATLILEGGMSRGTQAGYAVFTDRSSAAEATLIANGGSAGGDGGSIRFFDHSRGGRARLELFGNGNLDVSAHAAQAEVGSIEGDGFVFLGPNHLAVGANNLSTNFAGAIKDVGGIYGGTGGSLTKVGRGKLVLHHANIYTGGTTIERGTLVVNNTLGSGTGTGSVQVNGGTLAGIGAVAGAVTVGSGLGRESGLSPGYHHSLSPGTLTIQSALRFNSDATYEIEVNSSTETVDKVVAFGVTINTGAQTLFADLGNGTFTVGSIFTVIDNTSATPIAGTFSNLPDGAVFTLNGNNFQASYTGGTGNDLTLTVVP
jgi:autotransporter-associated beta strand protein